MDCPAGLSDCDKDTARSSLKSSCAGGGYFFIKGTLSYGHGSPFTTSYGAVRIGETLATSAESGCPATDWVGTYPEYLNPQSPMSIHGPSRKLDVSLPRIKVTRHDCECVLCCWSEHAAAPLRRRSAGPLLPDARTHLRITPLLLHPGLDRLNCPQCGGDCSSWATESEAGGCTGPAYSSTRRGVLYRTCSHSIFNTVIYYPPVISSISVSAATTTTVPTGGSGSLTIVGKWFGQTGSTADSQVYVGANICPVTALTNTQITCSLPAGTGSSNTITVKGVGSDNCKTYGKDTIGYAPSVVSASSVTSLRTADAALISTPQVCASVGGVGGAKFVDRAQFCRRHAHHQRRQFRE